jgi:hypothetical protein
MTNSPADAAPIAKWGIIVPRLESTVAALAFNRVAQEEFQRHDCATGSNAETAA